jgi:hypothetical protein
MGSSEESRTLAITWPLFHGGRAAPFPADPVQAVADQAPPSEELREWARNDVPPAPSVASEEAERRLCDSVPPSSAAPDWARAAQALVTELRRLIASGTVSPSEHGAIARAWVAWSLGGVPESHVLRVAHLVSRCHAAIQRLTQTGPELNSALRAAAGVLHSRMPTSLRERMPLARVVFVVYQLREAADPWVAVVDGTAELVGWKDYARAHAAAIIRTIMEGGLAGADPREAHGPR